MSFPPPVSSVGPCILYSECLQCVQRQDMTTVGYGLRKYSVIVGSDRQSMTVHRRQDMAAEAQAPRHVTVTLSEEALAKLDGLKDGVARSRSAVLTRLIADAAAAKAEVSR